MDTASVPRRIYLFICSRYRGRISTATQRQSKNSDPDFTDEGVLALTLPRLKPGDSWAVLLALSRVNEAT
ncbi:hypothetical protein GGP92_003129 [Salinibacter ruber]|nr:hypothetical protein [Salinibacter ruber]